MAEEIRLDLVAKVDKALEQAIKDNGESFNAGYVYVAGFAPLDRRDEKWREYNKK